MTTADQVIDRAAADVGFVEGPRSNETPYGAWYGLQLQPYCAMALSMWSHEAGLPIPASTPKGYAYTPSGAAWFQRQGRWGSTPKVGAHVFFRFSGPRIHHVGLVTGVGPGWIDTIEANTSRGSAGSQRDGGGVWRRRRSAGIVGYGYPAYGGGGSPPAAPPPTPGPARAVDSIPHDLPQLQRGARGQHVRNLQGLLVANGAPTGVDGDFGPATDRTLRAWQGRAGIGVDGIAGPATWGALLGPMPLVRRGDRGQSARNVQALLTANGVAMAIDGDFGPASEAGLRGWQGRAGIGADGVCGPVSWRALCSA